MANRNVVHIEIPAKNSPKAGQFYKDLCGWDIKTDPNMKYTMWDAGNGGSSGGFNEVNDEFKPGDVLIYVNSENIEADLKKAKSLGATIVKEKEEIPETGWFAIFKDPTGNRIALYTSMHPR